MVRLGRASARSRSVLSGAIAAMLLGSAALSAGAVEPKRGGTLTVDYMFDRLFAIFDGLLKCFQVQRVGIRADAAPMFFASDDLRFPFAWNFAFDDLRVVVIGVLQLAWPRIHDPAVVIAIGFGRKNQVASKR